MSLQILRSVGESSDRWRTRRGSATSTASSLPAVPFEQEFDYLDRGMGHREQAQRRSDRWFTSGANALQRVVRFDDAPHSRNVYACPECFSLHTRQSLSNGALTMEHVPPRKVDGRHMALTCASCNHGAGTSIDMHAAKQLRTKDILNLRRGQTRVELDSAVNALLRVPEPGSLEIILERRHNAPLTMAAFGAELERRLAAPADSADNGSPFMTLRLTEPLADAWKANLSYLRAAYLTVFARHGYRLILGRSYRPVRRQLRDIDSPAAAKFLVGDTFADTITDSYVGEGRIEGVGAAIVVCFGNRWIGLPPNPEDEEWWDRVAATESGSQMWIRNREPLPTGPEHRLDSQDVSAHPGAWSPVDLFGDEVQAA